MIKKKGNVPDRGRRVEKKVPISIWVIQKPMLTESRMADKANSLVDKHLFLPEYCLIYAIIEQVQLCV